MHIYFQIITGIALQDATSSAARVADSSKVDVAIEDMSCEAWVEKTLDVVAWLGFLLAPTRQKSIEEDRKADLLLFFGIGFYFCAFFWWVAYFNIVYMCVLCYFSIV